MVVLKKSAAVKRGSIIRIKIDTLSETCVWSSIRTGWSSHPTHGQVAERLVDEQEKAKPGDDVVLSLAWHGHYPTLKLKSGKLSKRVGQFWAVAFEGIPDPLLFNTNVGMRQLAYAAPPAPAPEEDVAHPQVL